jgi:outer membrane protein OmpA-like peptidoglycan-associated protein
MNRRIISVAAIAWLATVPVLAAASDDGVSDRDRRTMGIGMVAAGALGAIVGGPPGAIAGVTLAGITTDRELVTRRAAELEERTVMLERERLSLLSERVSLKARAEEAGKLLEQERAQAASAADTALLADGLEFAVGFRTNSAVPPEEAYEGLDALAMLVGAVPLLEVQLDGFADPRGSDALNHELSLARAAAIRDRLIGAGVDPERIRITAHGAVVNDSAELANDPDGWALQRRVSIRLENREGRLAATP